MQVLTAAHCYAGIAQKYWKQNENGDYFKIYPTFTSKAVYKYFGIRKSNNFITPWQEPVGPPNWYNQIKAGFYRTIEKVILNGIYFKSQKSWKGNDLALIKLGKYGQEWNKIDKKGINSVTEVVLGSTRWARAHQIFLDLTIKSRF